MSQTGEYKSSVSFVYLSTLTKAGSSDTSIHSNAALITDHVSPKAPELELIKQCMMMHYSMLTRVIGLGSLYRLEVPDPGSEDNL